MTTFSYLIAQADTTTEATSTVAIETLMDFIVKGGVMMIPIGLCSLVALAVFLERMMSLRRNKIIPPSFLPGLMKVLGDVRSNGKEAIEFCRRYNCPVANVFEAGIKKLHAPVEILEKHIQDAGQREVLKLRKNVRVLSVIAAISPLLGLLGTIFGMIMAFQTVALSADALGKTELLAEGIYMAMITTAAGLSVAIPVLIMYHWISAKIERLVMEIDGMTVEFIEKFAESGMDSAEADHVISAYKKKKTPGRDSDSRLESSSGSLATT